MGDKLISAYGRKFILFTAKLLLINLILVLYMSMNTWRFWEKWRVEKPKIRLCVVLTDNSQVPREFRIDIHSEPCCSAICEHHSLELTILSPLDVIWIANISVLFYVKYTKFIDKKYIFFFWKSFSFHLCEVVVSNIWRSLEQRAQVLSKKEREINDHRRDVKRDIHHEDCETFTGFLY